MLDADFKNVVTLRKPRVGSRKNASDVVWDKVLDAANSPVRIKCRFRRRGSMDLSTQEGQNKSDATMIFRVTSRQDVTRENLVICDRGEAYRVTSVTEEEDLELSTTYKQLQLQRIDKTFQEDPVDER